MSGQSLNKSKSKSKSSTQQYYLNGDGSFLIEDYNHAKVFANFFPGIAGAWGIPMWAFYVNRGQAISSFGIESKDKAILEFHPANKSYRLTSTQGFRTFLKVTRGKRTIFYEPFQMASSLQGAKPARMIITSHDLAIEEENPLLGLSVRVEYFTLPEEPYAGFVRRVIIHNTSASACEIEMADGLPAIVPYGLKDWLNKHLSRTIEAWTKVRNLEKKAPFFQLNVEVADTPQVTHITEGNFYFAFDPSSKAANRLLSPVVEPGVIFGASTDFLVPEGFLKDDFSVPSRQFTSNRTPCAFAHARFTVAPRQSKEIVAVAGYAHDVGQLNRIVTQAVETGFIAHKERRNKELTDEIKQYCFTASASEAFDQYCGQNFLDNVLRGGLPVSLASSEGPVALSIFSRKHGDLERDYNFFVLSPTFLSQGNGNFRDVNQNRRNDIWFNTDVQDSGIINFFNLVQADGYNPLVVRGVTFSLNDPALADKILREFCDGKPCEKIKTMLRQGFAPGELIQAITNGDTRLKGSAREFLTRVLGHCHKNELADHGEGFWVDHWTYNLDLLVSYLSIYPERLRPLLIENKSFSFYLNNAYVQPRERRYVLTPQGVRQYHAVKEGEEEVHAKARGFKLRTKNGEGEVYRTTLIVKLLCLLVNKAATLDPGGIGMEMEAGKPSWYDALNGLPGLLGSSLCETFELKRYAIFLKDVLDELKLKDGETVPMFIELANFLSGLTNILATEGDPLAYWKKSNDIKEHYRRIVRTGVEGGESAVTVGEIRKFLSLVEERADRGITSAKSHDGLFPTYFYHEVTKYELVDKVAGNQETTYVRPLAFKRYRLPLFLEGFVHALRVVSDPAQARAIYDSVKASPIFDRELKMYKVNADLSGESEEIGRTRIFPAGWLENESIWLHMEYKYLLELLRTGLHREFYDDLRQVLIPFQDPARYGRSPLENSSFLVASAHEDRSLHGQGFVARLSGSTAEFVHIWLTMSAGQKPFQIDAQGALTLQFKPVLAEWLFTKTKTDFTHLGRNGKWLPLTLPANCYAFHFLGSVLVVYHNPQRKDTFGRGGARVTKYQLTYPQKKKSVEIKADVIPQPYAEQVRERRVERIDVYLE